MHKTYDQAYFDKWYRDPEACSEFGSCVEAQSGDGGGAG
jgi:hypothetical protein